MKTRRVKIHTLEYLKENFNTDYDGDIYSESGSSLFTKEMFEYAGKEVDLYPDFYLLDERTDDNFVIQDWMIDKTIEVYNQKEEQCKYCQSDIPLLSKGSLVVAVENNSLVMTDQNANEGLDIEDILDINYCPVCGRKLKA